MAKESSTPDTPNMSSPPQEESGLARFRIPFYLALNATSSIGIVAMNKYVFEAGFRYGTLLTMVHFIVTFIGLEICRNFGVFEMKKVSILKVLPLSASFCGFVVLTNLSLVYNTIGFYQVMKVLTTPLLVVIQTLFYGETFSTKIKLSLGITCLGVIITTITDTSANLPGTLIALSALLVTCMYQIWVGTKQKELECSGFQLLYWQAPLSAAMLIPIVPLFDQNIGNLVELPPNHILIGVFMSSLLAFLVNLSIFLVIGKTSPVTYNVLGHFKLSVIMTLGFIFFGAPLDPKNLFGIFVTLAGVFWYTHIKANGQ